ncbi:MAG: tetratricopeptide repeat protein, partial [Caulobacterales bacterium]
LLLRVNQRDQAVTLLQNYRDQTGNPEIEAALTRVAGGARTLARPLTAARGAAIGVYGLGALLSQETEADDGLVILSLATMLDPTLDAAQLAFAESQRDRGHNEAARAALARLPQASPYAETASLMSAWTLRDDGEQEAALAAARQAAATGGRRSKTAYADLLRTYDHYSEAEPLYTELIGEGSDDWRLYFARGASRERLGRWSDAEADLQHALQIEPDQPDVLNYLGYSWVDRGEHLQEGLALITRALEARPNSGAILDSLGWAHYRLGDYEMALGYLERAVELEPSDPILNDHLGDCYWRVGRRVEARFQWRRVLTLKPSGDLEAQAQSKIEAGLPRTPLAENARRRQ